MIQLKGKHIFLYVVAIGFLLVGQRDFWQEIKESSKQKLAAKKMAEQALLESNKAFEVQELSYDSIGNTWSNKATYFQTIHIGAVNFKALKRFNKTTVETHDIENASDSF